MRNKFAGKCRRCQQIVPPSDGLAEKVGGRWEIVHVACPPPPEPRGMTAKQAFRSVRLELGDEESGDGDYDS